MSYKDSDLSLEIKDEIGLETAHNGVRIDADQIAFRIIKKHIPGFEKYEDFVTNCVWAHVRRITGAECRKWRFDEPFGDEQPELTGFERLQDYYEAESREGNVVRILRVRRMAMTTKQRRLVEGELRSNGGALIDHADQLGRETDELIAAGVLEPDEE